MGLFDFFKKKNKEENTKVPQVKINSEDKKQVALDEFAQDIQKSAAYFVDRSKERYHGLDYSVASLAVVDEMLEEAMDFYPDMNENQKQSLISSVGSYIFEVARSNYGGRYFWYDRLNQPIFVTGQPDFEVSILAFEKVKGRLENGSEDNIPFYFAGYTERVTKKLSGMIV